MNLNFNWKFFRLHIFDFETDTTFIEKGLMIYKVFLLSDFMPAI